MYALCSNPNFWHLKVLYRYGPEVAAVKPTNETWQEQAYRLSQLEYIPEQSYHSAARGALDELILMKKAGALQEEGAMMGAAYGGHSNIINWLLNAEVGLSGALANADWLLRRGMISSMSDLTGVIVAGGPLVDRTWNSCPTTRRRRCWIVWTS